MSNWRAILAHDQVCTAVFFDCHCCAKRLTVAEDKWEAEGMTDDMAIKLAHKKRWTTGIPDGQTLCPKCQKLSDEEAFAIYVGRLKEHYPHHELCAIWAEIRKKYHEGKLRRRPKSNRRKVVSRRKT